MNKIKQNIPNAITCGNLFCGCLAIVKAFEGDLVWTAYLVGIAAVLDFFDGFAARILKVSSPIGKDLDSLADMVTFGVVPGVVMYRMIFVACAVHEGFLSNNGYIHYIGFIIPVLSAIRLAKFNNDPRQSNSFIGLPTPANAILICSLPLIVGLNQEFDFINHVNGINKIILNPVLLIFASCVLALLLVAELPLFSLKFKSFGWKGNEIRYVFILLSFLLLIALQYIGIPLIITLYIVMSIFTKRASG